jgi:hypothetical protein
VIYGFSDLVLKAFSGVGHGGLEIIFVYEVLYFCDVLLGLDYDQGITFIGCGDHGVIFFKCGLD